MAIKRRAAVAAVLFSMLALVGAACSDDGPNTAGNSSNVSQERIDQLNERMERNEMLFAYISIGNIPLHEVDETLNGEAPAIEETFTPDVRTFVRLMALTDWSDELAEEAESVRQSGIALLSALEDADVEAAKPLATQVHDGWHEFSETVFAAVAEGLPPEEGGPEEDDDEESTPAADQSPAAEATP